MKNKFKTRILLSSMVLIMLSGVLIAGGTYGLYSAQTTVKNHLKAGNLNVSLFRNSYTKKVLDGNGCLTSVNNTSITEFTSATSENIFGLVDSDYIVPGSEFETNLEVRNSKTSGGTTTISTVAFQYSVSLSIKNEDINDLAKQLTISYKLDGGSYGEAKKISELGTTAIMSGKLKGQQAASAKFSIKLAFQNLTDNTENNKAQNQITDFDLVISAVQITSM